MNKKQMQMGTTASMLGFYRNRVYCCNVGDSPIFRFRNCELTNCFEEHTERRLFELLCKQEKLKGKKFSLTQYIGIQPDEMRIKPYLEKRGIKQGDIYLICSDGLTDLVKEEEICRILKKSSSLQKKVEQLLERALAMGGIDNITILGIRVGC